MQQFEKANQNQNTFKQSDVIAEFTTNLISKYLWDVSSRFFAYQNLNNKVWQA